MRRKTIEDCQKAASEYDGFCLSEKYFGRDVKMEWQCKLGHIFFTTFHIVKRGHWCPECVGVTRHNLEWLLNLPKAKNGKCLSIMYNGLNSYYLWECFFQHQWEAKAKDILTGRWCPYCAGKRHDLDWLKQLSIEQNGECLSNIYLGIHHKYVWKCHKDHVWEASANNVKKDTGALIAQAKLALVGIK
jgi:hypothetical protein